LQPNLKSPDGDYGKFSKITVEEIRRRSYDRNLKENAMENPHEFKIEDGAMIEVPAYEKHSRGKNWLAIIANNPKAPNGLDRVFQEKGKGPYYYMVDGLKAGDPVEFGADYYSGGGNRQPSRWYGVITEIDDRKIIIEEYNTAEAAIKAAAEKQPQNERERLEAEAERLWTRLAEIDKTLESQK
jgi:hypothetical protein